MKSRSTGSRVSSWKGDFSSVRHVLLKTKVGRLFILIEIRKEVMSESEWMFLAAHISLAVLIIDNLASSVEVSLLPRECCSAANILVPSANIGGEGGITSKLCISARGST